MSTRRGGGRGASWRRDLAERERGVMRVKQHRASAERREEGLPVRKDWSFIISVQVSYNV